MKSIQKRKNERKYKMKLVLFSQAPNLVNELTIQFDSYDTATAWLDAENFYYNKNHDDREQGSIWIELQPSDPGYYRFSKGSTK